MLLGICLLPGEWYHETVAAELVDAREGLIQRRGGQFVRIRRKDGQSDLVANRPTTPEDKPCEDIETVVVQAVRAAPKDGKPVLWASYDWPEKP